MARVDSNGDGDPSSGETRVRRPPVDEGTVVRGAPVDEGPVVRGVAEGAAVHVPRPALPAEFGEGYRLRGRYLLDKLIGQGAMGQVWRAKDLLGEEARDRNPFVAVKVLNSDFEGRPDAFVAMHREATRAQKLAHPNIVTVYVFDRDDPSGRAFIAMELLDGKPLDRVIRDAGPRGLPREQALPIIRGMAEGLAYAHRKGIVHSDFKPANVFLTADGTPKILDFGIARAVQVAGGEAGAHPGGRGGGAHAGISDGDGHAVDGSSDAHAQGDYDDSGFQGYTPSYAAPETLTEDGVAPKASTSEDVFALGIVAYELLTGQHPFKRRSAVEARAAGIEPGPLTGLKRREARAIARAMTFERAQRLADAAAFLKQLQGVPVVQKALAAAVAVLVLTAGGLWYRNYLDSLPNEPLERLPLQVQQEFRDKVRQGNESLDYLRRTQDITASADAAQYFAEAYRLHAKDPLAVRGLQTAADYAIGWYGKFPDRQEARTQLERFRAKSDYYDHYAPLANAIRAVGGQ